MSTVNDNEFFPLFRDGYKPSLEPYFIRKPDIPSGEIYLFESDSGIEYEVLFAKKRNNYLSNIVNFSVLNEEFDDEYSETNRGEVYRVIATVTEIVRMYHQHHGHSISYEFSGEFKDNEKDANASIRTLLYYRKAKELLHEDWDVKLIDNRVIVYRKCYTYE